MQPFPLRVQHLEQLRAHIAALVARLEAACAATAEPQQRDQHERTCAIARDLLDQVGLANKAVATRGERGEVDAVLQQLDERFAAGQARIDALQRQLDRIETPQRPDLEKPSPSSGSVIGDAVRDSFLNMG
jgi:hypothetical protein